MTSVVADTHALIWYIFDLDQLSEAALTALEQAVEAGDPVYVSAISVIEICYLVEKGRIAEAVLARVLNALDDANVGIVLAPINRSVSVTIRQIERAIVPDLPDRIIAATALDLNLPLVTRDARIRSLTTLVTIW